MIGRKPVEFIQIVASEIPTKCSAASMGTELGRSASGETERGILVFEILNRIYTDGQSHASPRSEVKFGKRSL
jgi:hypothetical protein